MTGLRSCWWCGQWTEYSPGRTFVDGARASPGRHVVGPVEARTRPGAGAETLCEECNLRRRYTIRSLLAACVVAHWRRIYVAMGVARVLVAASRSTTAVEQSANRGSGRRSGPTTGGGGLFGCNCAAEGCRGRGWREWVVVGVGVSASDGRMGQARKSRRTERVTGQTSVGVRENSLSNLRLLVLRGQRKARG